MLCRPPYLKRKQQECADHRGRRNICCSFLPCSFFSLALRRCSLQLVLSIGASRPTDRLLNEQLMNQPFFKRLLIERVN